MRKSSYELWKCIFDNVCDWNPRLTENVVEWYPLGFFTIAIEKDDGEIFECKPFNGFNFRSIFSYEKREQFWMDMDELYGPFAMQEDEWQEKFIEMLGTCMTDAGTCREYLAESSNVSRMSIYKYMGRQSTPSLYSATRLMKAMWRSLTDIDVPNNGWIDVKTLRTHEEWDEIFRDLEVEYPNLMADVIDWYPNGPWEVVVRTADSFKAAIDLKDFTMKVIHDPSIDDGVYISEDEWRREFSKILRDLIDEAEMTQFQLSLKTEITQSGLNKYINGKSTPSLYNATKIARALNVPLMKFYVE